MNEETILNFTPAQRRASEVADREHFLVFGHDDHAERGCMFEAEGGESCSRDYDPFPSNDSAPEPMAWYVGTGIGALYGLPGTEHFAWELAGWNVATRERVIA